MNTNNGATPNEFESFKESRRLLLYANIELFKLLGDKFGVNQAAVISQQLQFHLELLMDRSEKTRKEVYATLETFLYREEFLENNHEYKNLHRYFNYCYTLHGGQASYTLIFSSEEHDKYLESLRKSNGKGH
jgi:hypothetical protein